MTKGERDIHPICSEDLLGVFAQRTPCKNLSIRVPLYIKSLNDSGHCLDFWEDPNRLENFGAVRRNLNSCSNLE